MIVKKSEAEAEAEEGRREGEGGTGGGGGGGGGGGERGAGLFFVCVCSGNCSFPADVPRATVLVSWSGPAESGCIFRGSPK